MQNLLLSQLAAANDRVVTLEAEARKTAAKAAAALTTTPTATPTATRTNTMATVATTNTASATASATASTAPTAAILTDSNADEYLEELESEVTFLRLQLRGIEVRYRTYVPVDADPELDECIENWKADWVALQAKVTQELTLEKMPEHT